MVSWHTFTQVGRGTLSNKFFALLIAHCCVPGYKMQERDLFLSFFLPFLCAFLSFMWEWAGGCRICWISQLSWLVWLCHASRYGCACLSSRSGSFLPANCLGHSVCMLVTPEMSLLLLSGVCVNVLRCMTYGRRPFFVLLRLSSDFIVFAILSTTVVCVPGVLVQSDLLFLSGCFNFPLPLTLSPSLDVIHVCASPALWRWFWENRLCRQFFSGLFFLFMEVLHPPVLHYCWTSLGAFALVTLLCYLCDLGGQLLLPLSEKVLHWAAVVLI